MKNSDRLINANIKQFVNDSSAQFKPQNIVTKTKNTYINHFQTHPCHMVMKVLI